MISDELVKIVTQLNNEGRMDYIAPATEEQINHFEEENSVNLPKQFKEWLQYSDGGECFLPAGVQFYGVAHKPLIDVSDDNRPADKYTVIGALSNGDPILCENGNEQISIYNQEGGRIEDDETYPDFYSFLNDLHELLGIGG